MQSFIDRVKYALAGWVHFFRTETNGRIQAVVAILVIIAGFILDISRHDWLWILLCIGLVIALEMVNTAVETLANKLHPDKHVAIKIVKDVAAGAVLWASVVSVIIGVVIFWPYIQQLIVGI